MDVWINNFMVRKRAFNCFVTCSSFGERDFLQFVSSNFSKFGLHWNEKIKYFCVTDVPITC